MSISYCIDYEFIHNGDTEWNTDFFSYWIFVLLVLISLMTALNHTILKKIDVGDGLIKLIMCKRNNFTEVLW